MSVVQVKTLRKVYGPVLGGSEGGIDSTTAKLLAEQEYATLVLAYFGVEHLAVHQRIMKILFSRQGGASMRHVLSKPLAQEPFREVETNGS